MSVHHRCVLEQERIKEKKKSKNTNRTIFPQKHVVVIDKSALTHATLENDKKKKRKMSGFQIATFLVVLRSCIIRNEASIDRTLINRLNKLSHSKKNEEKRI